MLPKKYWPAASKWEKYITLARDPLVRPYLPQTEILNNNTLKFIAEHPVVFLKPVIGGGGYGVIKISRLDDKYVLQTGTQKKIFTSKRALIQALHLIKEHRPYIIQQGIDLLSINNRPMDFRVLILRPQQQWRFMGIMGKLAARNKIVTNHCKGGHAITLQTALKTSRGLSDEECVKLEEQMISFGLAVAKTIQKRFRHVRELGLDVALDQDLNIWLIEANTRPMYKLFKHHKDRTLFGKIHRTITYIRSRKKKAA